MIYLFRIGRGQGSAQVDARLRPDRYGIMILHYNVECGHN